MLSLIIPCFNEEENLEKLLSSIKSLLKKYRKIEILIVDNGSTDRSEEIIIKNSLFLQNKISLIKIDKNIGYGNVIYKGILSSKGEFIVWCHVIFKPIRTMIEIFLKSKEKLYLKMCGKGKRIKRGFFDEIFTVGMSIITLIFFKFILNDINAQPKIINKELKNKLENAPKDFSFDLYLLLVAKKENLPIYEFPVVWNNRYAGEAKGGGTFKLKFKLTLRTLKFMFKLKKDQKWN